jgi:predicted O-linked N-acetylglucosamine transferase (SPINDLY family)
MALHTQGIILSHMRDFDGAISFFKQAIERDDSRSFFFVNLSAILTEKGSYAEAHVAAARAVELDSHSVGNLIQFGYTYITTNEFEKAHEVYEQAFSVDSESIHALTEGLSCARRIGDFAAASRWQRRIADLFTQKDPSSEQRVSTLELINLAYSDVLAELPNNIFNRCIAAINSRLAHVAAAPQNNSEGRADKKLRIGYLSGKLGDHPIGHVTQALFEAHDRSRFEVHAFSLTDRQHEVSGHTDAIKAGCDHFHETSAMAPAAIATYIRQVGIDILIFLDGLMMSVGLEILAHRPAGFQVFWLGHAGTLAFSFIDATVADQIVLPEYSAYGSSVIRLPVCYHCASPQRITHCEDVILKEQVLQRGNPFVFCAFNNPEKINACTFDAWMEILREAPNSLIWLSNQFKSEALERNLRKEAEQRGVDPTRLVFATRVANKALHLGRHHQAGLLLDAFDLNASTTGLDALWSGVPLLTRTGSRFGSRIATTFLTHLGLNELICSTSEEFISRAVMLAKTPSALSEIRSRLASAVWDRDLFKPTAFARAFEAELVAALMRSRSSAN